MKTIHLVHVLVCSAWLCAGCASITARSKSDHVPGTLYPGPKVYFNNWDSVGNVLNDNQDRYEASGPVVRGIMFTVALPFVAGDIVASSVFDTLALPYDCFAGRGSRETATVPVDPPKPADAPAAPDPAAK
jgi:uncharacterized protein YceK